MNIIKIDLTAEQIAALAPLQAKVQEAYDKAQEASPTGATSFIPPLGMILGQIFVGKRSQIHCEYIPPDVAAELLKYFQRAMNIA